jgi:outer membrane protein TolC
LAHAEEATRYDPPEFIREQPILPERMAGTTVRKMTLHDAMQIAVQNNLSIVLKKEQFVAAREGIPAARGTFEPAVVGGVQHVNTDSPPSTVQEGQADQLFSLKSDGWNVGVNERILTGATVGVELTSVRTRSSLGNAVQPVLDRSALNLKLTQPILKGFAFSFEVPYADVLRAEFASESARQDVLGQLIATVRDTELAYWDVVLALKSYEVQKASLELGRQQLTLTRRQIDAGILPPSDMINAEGTVAQRELGLVDAEADIAQRADDFRKILNLPKEAWKEPILPLDTPRFDDQPVTCDSALARALKNRPEWKQRHIDVDKAALDARVAASEQLPQLDASFTYGLVGQKTAFRGALDQIASADAPAWTAALNLTWTPFNVTANAKLAAKRATESAARTALDQQLLDVYAELRTAIRALETAIRSVRAAATFRTLAERSLDAEQRKFLNGTSNNFFVAQRQNDVVQAKLAEVAALIRHQKAVTTLKAAMGVLLEDERVQLDVRPR